MDAQHSIPSPVHGGGQPGALREILGDAIRYWEPRRIAYNVVLAVVVVAWLALTWPHFRGAMHPGALVFLAVFAMLANICYCAAYMADIPIQCTLFRVAWRRRRWGLWLAGMLFATLLANYWIADEIYPYVQ